MFVLKFHRFQGFDIVKWSQKKNKENGEESHLNTSKTAEQAEKKASAVPASYSTSWRDEEELVNYEPESPPSFSPTVEELSEPEDRVRTPVPGQADNSTPDDFRANPVKDAAMAGRKRRRNFQQPLGKDDIFKDDSAAHPRKGGKSVIRAKRDENVANLPRITSGGSNSASDKGESAAPPRGEGGCVLRAI